MSDLKHQLQDYVDATIERVDAEDVRAEVWERSPSIGSAPPRPRPAWAFVLGAASVLAVAGIAMLLRGDTSVGDDLVSSPKPTLPDETGQGGVFTFARHDLCEWVSDDEMTLFVRKGYAEAGIEWDGSAIATLPSGTAWAHDYEYCRWRLSGGGQVIAGDLGLEHLAGPIVEYPTVNEAVPIGAFSGHPDLPEHVIVGNVAFGRFGFWQVGSAEALGLELASADQYDLEWAEHDAMLLSIANSLLDTMGWTGSMARWNPILSTTVAGDPPSPAECGVTANPNTLGPDDQERPWGTEWTNQAAAFDSRLGRIVMLDETSETWAFDVCTNRWHRLDPKIQMGDGVAWSSESDGGMGQLVYDVDSDRTIGFGGSLVAVFDAQANTWTLRPLPTEYQPASPGSGAVYDPNSGLVVLNTHLSGLVAYDVDTDTWTPIGVLEDDDGWPPYLAGYLRDSDHLVFIDGFGYGGMLVDRLTGTVTELTLPSDLFAGFGKLDFTAGSSASYVSDDSVCRLGAASRDWLCAPLSSGPNEFGPEGSGLLAAVVEDPINDRLVLLYGYGNGFSGERFHEVNDIWGIDVTSGEWTQLLKRSGQVSFEEEG